MRILSIDTTGFSTSVTVVENGKNILFLKTVSSYLPCKDWSEFVVVLPINHQKNLIEIFKKNKINWNKIDAIAVSAKSGIYNCILIGTSVARVLSQTHNKPLIEVDHVLAHIYSTWIGREIKDFNFPILTFSASGSSSEIAIIKNNKNCEIICDAIPKQKSGETEVFLGIGKIFDQFGRRTNIIKSNEKGVDSLIKCALGGDSQKFNFIKYYKGSELDLNFADFLESIIKFYNKEKRRVKNSKKFLEDLAASFEESIVEILSEKILKIAQEKKAKEIHIAGGLAVNKNLKKKLVNKIADNKNNFILRYPIKKEYSLDNAAMIGGLAYYIKINKINFKNFKENITY